ncbi:MAG TPA: DegT/DnrJ/EryC1/StrS family aminotransferase [Candidatus Limnocylindrales bacterium]|nr:DegT/DnrJ/EryC1/StrS family aminotransferase [Candidatus Limnocylindrales bacterium]
MSVSDARIPLAVPTLEGREREYLEECIRTNFVSSVGPFVTRFEEAFAAAVGTRYAVACASGTAAIHLAMRVLGVVPGDEVFVSTLTFVASANPVLYERAVPVLVDSERSTMNLDPSIVADELARRARAGQRLPRAIEVVHLLGHPADLAPIVEVAARHGVPIVEDASEALGATWTDGPLAGRQVGSVGLLGCFSFNGNKLMTTGGGGMVTTDDEALARRVRHLSTQARLPGRAYRHDEVGYNYRLTNVAAALGLAQLERLPELLAARRAIAGRYDAVLGSPDGGLRPALRAPWADPSFWLYTAHLAPDAPGASIGRERLIDRLDEAGIEARPIWTPLHTLPLFADAPRLGGRVAEEWFAGAVSLPSSSSLGPEQQARVVAGLAAAGVIGRSAVA